MRLARFKFSGSSSWVVACVYSLCFVSLPFVLLWAYSSVSPYYLPNYSGLALGVAAAFVMALLRNPANRFVAHLWMIWFFVGCLNALSSYYLIGSILRPWLSRPTIIYFAFVCVMFSGMVIVERFSKGGVEPEIGPVRRELSFSVLAALIVFSVLWATTLIYYAGGAPILSGADITDSIYETNYGPLYGYALVTVLAVLAAMSRATSGSRRLRFYYIALVVVLVSLSVVDGKRYLLILMLLGMCFIALRVAGARRARIAISAIICAAAVMYLLVFIVRQGLNFERYGDGLLSLTSIAGVEFRDFSRTVARHEPGSIPNYEWLASGAGAMINGGLLGLLGVDKNQLMQLDSARAWSSLRLFSSPYGIRTGIVSELWFAYGWGGLAWIFAIGGLVSRAAIYCMRSATDRQLVNRSCLLALLTSLIMGQTTVITGSLTVLLYVNIAYWVFRSVRRMGLPRAQVGVQ